VETPGRRELVVVPLGGTVVERPLGTVVVVALGGVTVVRGAGIVGGTVTTGAGP
jgi:hypothetical protein